MSKREFVNPAFKPAEAAQEVLLELVAAGFANSSENRTAMGGQGRGENLAASLIAVHKELTAYYRSLSAEQ